jgi:hypothetical protein
VQRVVSMQVAVAKRTPTLLPTFNDSQAHSEPHPINADIWDTSVRADEDNIERMHTRRGRRSVHGRAVHDPPRVR